ncbi:putative 18.8 kDa protein [Paraburkholderia ribeironis]|uniref:Putative 18.8 kDa protein n=1 Tax=Paraburkholderia ribeironis TaxID=1247936 RepID=A0A1N7SPI4_9BURK|nr:Mov34/MPN/PAD-1 family protein [Paraburkholderia ribeironis]SIT49344.1 putative 18.8 kDa protein [Paraburkholderia ribeironis]
MSQLWIASTAFDEMLDEAERVYPLETGGVLVGYAADDGDLVVQHVIGPGLSAQHKRQRFHPDHDWQCRRLDEIFEISSGQAVYVGDWHTHPDGSPQMSWLDKRTLRGIARYREAALARPLMLIGAGGAERWRWQAHRYSGDRMGGLNISVDVLELRLFGS